MANVDSPFGLKLSTVNGMGTPNWSIRPYYLPASYGTAAYIGDPVLKTGTSNTSVVNAIGGGSFEIGTMPEINIAAVGDAARITGVIVGFYAHASHLDKAYNPASTERVALVCDDPRAIFEIQADGAIAAAQVGLNAVLIATHSGVTATGLSGHELDTTSDAPAADASNQLLILGQVNRSDNEPNLIHNKVLVMITNHTEAHGNTAAGDGILGI